MRTRASSKLPLFTCNYFPLSFFLKKIFPPKYFILYARYRRFIDTNNNKLILPGYGKACSVDVASTIVGSADAAVVFIILILCVFFPFFLLNPENS